MQKYTPAWHQHADNGEIQAHMREDSDGGEWYSKEEVDAILREAHYFASEDFQFSDHYNSLTIDDVCATQRYIDYWKALNKALWL